MIKPQDPTAGQASPSAAETLLETQAMLAAIGRIQAQLLTRKDAQAAFDALLEELLRASGSAFGFIGEVRHDTDGAPWLSVHAFSDIDWEEGARVRLERAQDRGLAFRRLDTLIGAVLTSEELVISNDPAADPRSGGVPAGHPPLHAFLGVPFRHGERMTGMVGLANRPGGYSGGVVEMLQPVLDTVRTVLVAYRAERSRMRAEAAAVRLNRRLEASVAELQRILHVDRALSEMRDRLQACQSIEGICEVAETFTRSLLGATGGSVHLHQDGADERRDGVAPAAQRTPRLRLAHRWGERGVAFDAGAGADLEAAARAAQTVVACDDAQASEGDGPTEAPVTGARQVKRRTIPLVAQGEPLGLLQLSCAGTHPAPADRAEIVENIASHLALTISNLRMRNRLREQAIRDPLTGLYNRRQMDDVFERELRRAQRHRGTLGVLMVDIDHFKRINDSLGHEAGDEVLRALARCLGDAIRREDYVFRYGGEEFLLLLPQVGAGAVAARAQSLLEAVRGLHVEWRDRPVGPIRVSIGAATFPEDGQSPAQLVRAADEAMYRAKRSGRDRVCLAAAESEVQPAPRTDDPDSFALV